jgi:uncharacterized protein YkvS
MSSDIATVVYSYFFVTAGILGGLGFIAKATIKKHTEVIEDKLAKIEYALFNDGQTGLINKVDQLIENQNSIKIDVEVMKAISESKPTRSRKTS